MRTVKVHEGQSIFDIAIQKCGSADSAFEIAKLNDISISAEIVGGTILVLPNIKNVDNAKVFEVGKIEPATAITESDITNTIEGEGIGYWSIENDFKVS